MICTFTKNGDVAARQRVITYMGKRKASSTTSKDREARLAYELDQAIKQCRNEIEILPRSNSLELISQLTGTNPNTLKSQITKVKKKIDEGQYSPLVRGVKLDLIRGYAYHLLTGKEGIPKFPE